MFLKRPVVDFYALSDEIKEKLKEYFLVQDDSEVYKYTVGADKDEEDYEGSIAKELDTFFNTTINFDENPEKIVLIETVYGLYFPLHPNFC